MGRPESPCDRILRDRNYESGGRRTLIGEVLAAHWPRYQAGQSTGRCQGNRHHRCDPRLTTIIDVTQDSPPSPPLLTSGHYSDITTSSQITSFATVPGQYQRTPYLTPSSSNYRHFMREIHRSAVILLAGYQWCGKRFWKKCTPLRLSNRMIFTII